MRATIIVILIVILGGLIASVSRTNNGNVSKGKDSSMLSLVENARDEKKLASAANEQYMLYSRAVFDAASEKKRILYFHADWCPTCRISDKEFTDQPDAIPKNVILFKVNYDTESSLKNQYAITYQHTFVLVDTQGKELKKWNGGGIKELVTNID